MADTPDYKKTLFELLGGRPTLERVHKIFYDKLYADPWIGQYFKAIDQKHIENQQTDFMTPAMGGPEIYSGAFPIPAHKHMYITDELFTLRNGYLKDSLREAGVTEELAAKWLKIDGAFRTGIVKKTIMDCQKRFVTDDILDYRDPSKKAA